MNTLFCDVNLVLNPSLDTENYSGNNNNPKARYKLFEVMFDLQLLDYYRTLNPDKKLFTWGEKNPFNRLDYILISEYLSNLVVTRIQVRSLISCPRKKFNSFQKGKVYGSNAW